MFSFHGHGDNMENFQHTDMHRHGRRPSSSTSRARRAHATVSGWQVEKGQDDDRDLRLVDAALASLRDKFKVDDARIYSTGFSNGANFTYLLWAERPGVFAAFAPVAARLRPSVQPKQPSRYFMLPARGMSRFRLPTSRTPSKRRSA